MARIQGQINIYFDTDKEEVTQDQFDAFKKQIESSGIFQLSGIVEEAAAETGCGECISMHSVTADDSAWICENESGTIE